LAADCNCIVAIVQTLLRNLVVALLWSGVAPAQGGVVRPLSGKAALEKEQITFERQDGQVVQVRWGKQQIPITPRATNLACGLSRDGKQLVLLANGVRESLVVYVVGKKAGDDLFRFPTDGGRQLRRDFNDGQGSWPWVEGSHLILFGYEKDGKLEFRAASQSGQVHANRQLDLGLKGWRIESDPDGGFVRVRFSGVAEPLEFHHPLSPRLELVNGLLRFGTVQLGSSTKQLVLLSNSGKRPLTLKLGLRSPHFVLGANEALERRLAPGERSRIEVIFKPKGEGVHEARMKLSASGSIRELLVVLRGEAQAAAKAKPATTSKPTAKATGNGKADSPENTRLDPPLVREYRLHPLGEGEVLVLGRVDPTDGATQLSLRNALTRTEVSAQADATGHFRARLRARDFVRIQIAAANGKRRSEWKEVGEVQPQLEITGHGKELLVRCLPDQRFLLLAVAPGGSERVFGSWRGKAGSTGLARYPLGSFGVRKGSSAPLALVLVTEVDGEKRTSTRLRLQ
jgi:hypothetical protein